MIVMLLEKVPLRLRGELTRWLIEPRTGVFVGHVNAMVRDRLWQKCCKARGMGGVIQVWSTNNEQHFAIRMNGDTSRQIVELEGLQFVQVPFEASESGDDIES
jgi:CRISPR-associated protein Cas2